ncbi:helix-turn-helix domain-containing protein [Novosphingobium panipatense]|uniref:helix-turn-helix domain-containing protein n=1 Tax=Novosphingobium panipatense TaxID=428991 RepID=UPI0039A2D209
MTDSYRHLRYDEREALAKMRDAAIPVSEIATRLGRHRSTIYRELRRNFMHDDDLPPAEWPRDYDSLDHERDDECRARSTSRKRLSASCVKLRLCWRREPRQQRRAAGSQSASRHTIAGARNMAA